MTDPEDNKYQAIFKLILIGESDVGKSKLLRRLTKNDFDTETQTTVGVEFGAKDYIINNNLIKLQIWDTAGQERFRAMTTAYYKGANGALLVYDITNIHTFTALDSWIQEFKQYAGPDHILVLIGNKSDLNAQRQVTTSQGLQYAQNHSMAFIETSAKNSENVNDAFELITQQIYQLFCGDQASYSEGTPNQSKYSGQAKYNSMKLNSPSSAQSKQEINKSKSCC